MSRTKMVAVALLVTMVGVWAARSFLLDDSESTAPAQTSAVSAEPEGPRTQRAGGRARHRGCGRGG